VLDPQSWDTAGCGKYFERACTLKADRSDCRSCPPGAGSDWSAPLYEEFRLPLDPWLTGLDSQFQVVLDVTSARETDHYQADFCLHDALYTRVGNDSSGTIDVDEGFSRASAGSGGWIALEAEKLLRFAGWTDPYGNDADAAVNWTARVLLWAMGEGLQEQACCPVPPNELCVDPSLLF
jgi:hypothetical protein